MKKCTLLLIGALLVLMTLCLGGCGGSSGGSSDSGEKAEQSNTSTSESAPTLADSIKEKEESDAKAKEDKKNEQNLTVGSTGEADGIKVTLDSVALSQGSEYDFTELKEGNAFLIFNVTLENEGDKDYSPMSASTELYADNSQCEEAFITTEGTNIVSLSPVNPGKTASGNVVYQAPTTASSFEFDFAPEGSTGDVLYFTFDTTQITQ